MKICSVGTTEGFYYRPRIDDHVIESYGTDGLIGMSACIAGRIAQNILKDRIEEAEKWAIYYYKMFNGNFYLEIQPTKDPEQVKVNLGIIELHKKLGIPIVATSDAHYLQREDSKTHDMLLCIQSGSLITDPNRWRFPGDTFFVASRDEMTQLFKESGHEVLDQRVVEEAMDMTVEIANQCNVTFNWDKHYLPKIDPPADNDEFNKWSANRQSDGSVSADYLRYLCIKGLKTKGLTSKEYRDRLDFELDVIDKMGFPDYFLIFWDIMKYCREEDIPVGPGRGCFSKDNDVVLSNGNKYKINEVKIGDKVVGYDEQEHEVIDTLQYDCNEELVQLQLDDKKIECTKDHKIYAINEDDWNKGIREPKWYEANEIGPNDYVAELD
jgi:DNA polymerase-3 subunit alpha